MPPRTLSEQWEALRPRLNGFRRWLGTPERTHRLLVLLWPLVALVIAVLIIRLVSTAKELADLISAFASLMWPVVTLAIVSWFRLDIRAILSRIRRGKFLGQEIELDELQAKAEVAEAKADMRTGAMIEASAGFHGSGTIDADVAQDAVEEVLREAVRSPRLGLLLLSAKMERAVRDLAHDSGLDGPVPLVALIRGLAQAEQLTPEDVEALNLFNQIRNRIVHGHDAGEEDIARAIDSGTRVLRSLLSRPRPQPETKGLEEG